MNQQLKSHFTKYVYFEQKEIDEILSHFNLSEYDKKEFLLKEGQICRQKFFIIKGLVRSYHLNNKGNEKIQQFAIENWWVSNVESFTNETPSSTSIETLEPTITLNIDKDSLESLYFKFPKLKRYFRIITENMLIAIQRRYEVFLQMKSQERYLNFINNLPEFSQRVPQYMIASYLEITPEYLSELRKA
ncbi:Crp/Fnr family transcriptional regulator [Corallibacter sp.]|uniref:Crp/Fnr family transcriptional regulator n=1 Tax=Corallibacter sp. TaxID=2038084 RepID=UPI003AB6A940